VLFAQGWLRLRRRGRTDLADWRRAALFATGLVVVLAGLVSPIHTIGENHLLWVHMLQHVLIGDLGIALAIVALRGPLLVFWFPPLYPLYRGAYGFSALGDQKLAGLVMMGEQLLMLGTFVYLLIRPRLRHPRLAPA